VLRGHRSYWAATGDGSWTACRHAATAGCQTSLASHAGDSGLKIENIQRKPQNPVLIVTLLIISSN